MAWQTAWNPTLEDGSTPVGVRNFRNVIDANTSSYTGTKVRITLEAHAGTNCVVDGVSIGLMTTADDMDNAANGTFKRITWVDAGGGDGITVPMASTVVSDEITFSFDKTKRYGIHTYQASKAGSKYSDANGHGTYYNDTAVDDTLTQAVAYTPLASWVWLVSKVEVFVEEAVTYTPQIIMIT